jgi:mannose-6-phosphate isomerase-like protein (cupin superfamily)
MQLLLALPDQKGERSTMQFNRDIVALAQQNKYFRQEVVTGAQSQVVLMSLPPGGEIGEETHPDVDQVLVFVSGEGKAILNGEQSPVAAQSLCFVPARTTHNFINTGTSDLKLYTVYAPPEHAPGTVHRTKAEADAAEHAERLLLM